VGNEGTGLSIGDEATVRNGWIAGNQWGGVHVSGTTAELDHLFIVGNTRPNTAGSGLMVSSGAEAYITNSTIVGNTSPGGSGGLHGREAHIEARNTIVAFNDSSPDGGGVVADLAYGTSTIVMQYCDVYGNIPTDFVDVTDPTGTDGNVSIDPMFLDITAIDPVDWDLHLGSASPLVDVGDPGILDPDGSVSDMGAYGGAYAGGWDLDGDGYPSWWQPGDYEFATYPALGWDCDDLDAEVYPGSGC